MSDEYSQGVMMDGAAILHNGAMITIDEIVSRLNQIATLQRERDEAKAEVGLLRKMVGEADAKVLALQSCEVVMRKALTAAKRMHHICEDPWYSCPMSEEGCADERETECNCGADRHNAAIDAALASQPAPKPQYIREPAKDMRISRGDYYAGDCWRDTTTDGLRMCVVGYDPNSEPKDGGPYTCAMKGCDFLSPTFGGFCLLHQSRPKLGGSES